VGRTGNVFARTAEIVSAAVSGRPITPSFRLNDEKFENRVGEIAGKVGELLDKPYELKEKVIVIRVKNLPDKIDEQAFSDFLTERMKNADFSDAEFPLKEQGTGLPDLETILKEIKTEPKNASLDLAAAKDDSRIIGFLYEVVVKRFSIACNHPFFTLHCYILAPFFLFLK
jgi:hypothetical protein